jgi:hypothetical protein
MIWLHFDGLSCRFSISIGLETHKYVHTICVTVYTHQTAIDQSSDRIEKFHITVHRTRYQTS